MKTGQEKAAIINFFYCLLLNKSSTGITTTSTVSVPSVTLSPLLLMNYAAVYHTFSISCFNVLKKQEQQQTLRGKTNL